MPSADEKQEKCRGDSMKITTSGGRVLLEREGNLEGAELSGLKLSDAHFAHESLVGATLTGAILIGANFDEADLSNACLMDALMSGAFLMSAKCDNANMRGADLYWALGFQASFRGADLTGADFRGADLQEADFTGASLEQANFGRDNLNGSTSVQGANFSGTNLKTALLEGALYDSRTRFPEGFNPKTRGMILWGESR